MENNCRYSTAEIHSRIREILHNAVNEAYQVQSFDGCRIGEIETLEVVIDFINTYTDYRLEVLRGH